MNRLVISFFCLIFVTACAGGASTPASSDGGATASMEISSPAFAAGSMIPVVFTCDGEDKSPALEWSAPPGGTQSLVLVMDDPDAPLGTWVHWIVMDLPPEARGLVDGASTANKAATLPTGAFQGVNSWGREEYGGPCPPSGTHRYYFRLYALDIVLGGQPLDKAGLLRAIDGHVLAQGEFYGTYSK